MAKVSKIIACLIAAAITYSSMGVMTMSKKEILANAENSFSISIDGNSITGDSLRLGAVSANNSSRLLMDYKEKNEKAYWEIMNYLFNKKTGIGLSHIKIELGSDCDSSSGTEPATMRYENEDANVNRGAGFHLCADAKTINPDISIDLLRWGSPNWTGSNGATTEENMAKRFKWYKNTLDAAYDEYGLVFDYVSADRNEIGEPDTVWIKYLRKHLDSSAAEADAKYDYSKIKLIASDEVLSSDNLGNYIIADEMMKDAELRDAVDVLGFHYSTWSGKNALELKEKYGKEIWYSEGTAVTIDPEYAVNANNASGAELDDVAKGTGLTGINGPLEIAVRVLNMYAQQDYIDKKNNIIKGGGMTMYEFQPAVAAYYTGAQYVPKQLILADTPWSGYYNVQVGTYIMEHFTRFQTDNMKYVDGACYGDGIAAGDGHGIGSTTNNYITLADPDTGDYTMVFVNDTSESRSYDISVSNLSKADSPLTEWVTKGPDAGQAYDANWLKNSGTINPENGHFTYKVEPYSIVTLTTTTGQKGYADEEKSKYQQSETNTNLSLPYTDDFNYSDEFLRERGGTPLYTCDAGGAFEVVKKSDGSKVLQQKIDNNIKPLNWGVSSTPTTTLGDTSWADYSVSMDVKLEPNNSNANNAGVGLRSIGTCSDISMANKSGYWLKLSSNGKYSCMKANSEIGEGTIKNFNIKKSHNLKVSAVGNEIVFYIDNTAIFGYTDNNSPYLSGRVGIYSSNNTTEFDNLKVEEARESLTAADASSYVNRIDSLDSSVKYSDSWVLKVGDSFKLYNRTSASTSEKGSSLEYTFKGTGINFVTGAIRATSEISVEIDGKSVGSSISLTSGRLYRQSLYSVSGLSDGQHNIKLTVNSGNFAIDCIEIYGVSHKTVKALVKNYIADYTEPAKSTTAVSKVSSTRNAKAVKKDKAAAKKAMKKAKISKLTVKSSSKKRINVSWKKVKKAKGYEVQVSTNRKFKKSKIILDKFITKKKLNIKNIKKIKSKRTYYVRVRAYAVYKNKNYKPIKLYSKWSKGSKVKVK